jgi:hypothetical protein
MTHEPRPRSTPPPIAFFTLFLVGLLTAAAFKAIREYVLFLNQRETARVTSPDRLIDAVFVQPAIKLVANESDLYLVPRGEPAPSWGAVVGITNINEPANLIWTRSGMLEFKYGRGCVQKFSNFWRSDDVGDGQRFVELRLAPDSEMPCTGETTKPTPALKPPMRVNSAAIHTVSAVAPPRS